MTQEPNTRWWHLLHISHDLGRAKRLVLLCLVLSLITLTLVTAASVGMLDWAVVAVAAFTASAVLVAASLTYLLRTGR